MACSSLWRMELHHQTVGRSGHTLLELLVVLAIIGVCLLAGTVSLTKELGTEEGRGAAQTWQAAAAWAQLGVLWHGGSAHLQYQAGEASLVHDFSEFGGTLGLSAATVPVSTNLSRWKMGSGVSVGFTGALGSPDGGGSLLFGEGNRLYHLVVRPESGLSVRSISVSAGE